MTSAPLTPLEDSLRARLRMTRRLSEGKTMAVLVIGSRNPKKKVGLLEILGELGFDLHDLTRYPEAPEVEEDGETFEANARKKAVEVAKALGAWVLGEDSGLVVPALNGEPGVYSARYAGKQGDDEANNEKLLAAMASLPDE